MKARLLACILGIMIVLMATVTMCDNCPCVTWTLTSGLIGHFYLRSYFNCDRSIAGMYEGPVAPYRRPPFL